MNTQDSIYTLQWLRSKINYYDNPVPRRKDYIRGWVNNQVWLSESHSDHIMYPPYRVTNSQPAPAHDESKTDCCSFSFVSVSLFSHLHHSYHNQVFAYSALWTCNYYNNCVTIYIMIIVLEHKLHFASALALVSIALVQYHHI